MELQLYSAVSQISGTADTSQNLTTSADLSPHKYLNPQIPKAKLAVTLKHGISAKRNLLVYIVNTSLNRCTVYYNRTYLPSSNYSMIKIRGNVYSKIFLLCRMYSVLYCYLRLILYKHLTYTGCFTTLGHNCRRRFPRSL